MDVPPRTSWLGSPAIFLPRRQASKVFDEALTFHPTPRMIAVRLAIEFWRAVGPPALMYATFFTDVAASVTLATRFSPRNLALILPGVFLASAIAVVLVVALLKWILVGRYRPRVEPQWANFVRRSELVTGLYENTAVPALLDWLAGNFVDNGWRVKRMHKLIVMSAAYRQSSQSRCAVMAPTWADGYIWRRPISPSSTW